MSSEEKDEEKVSVERLSLKDFNISDEYDTVTAEDPLKEAAGKLITLKNGVVFVMSGDVPVGIIAGEEVIAAVSDGKGPETPCREVASTRILKISYDIKMTELIPLLVKERPRAIAVMDENEHFKGYFSPKDSTEALKKAGIIP